MSLKDVPLVGAELSKRTTRCLTNAGYINLQQVVDVLHSDGGEAKLFQINSFGAKCMAELKHLLRQLEPQYEAVEWAKSHVAEVRAIIVGNAVIVPTIQSIRHLL